MPWTSVRGAACCFLPCDRRRWGLVGRRRQPSLGRPGEREPGWGRGGSLSPLRPARERHPGQRCDSGCGPSPWWQCLLLRLERPGSLGARPRFCSPSLEAKPDEGRWGVGESDREVPNACRRGPRRAGWRACRSGEAARLEDLQLPALGGFVRGRVICRASQPYPACLNVS